MFYVKLDSEGNVESYPYTLTDLRRDNNRTSFPRIITDEMAAVFNCFPVAPTVSPTYDHTKNLERSVENTLGVWSEVWIETDATSEQITERIDNESEIVIEQIKEKLSDTDWTQLLDSNVDQQAWAAYRAELIAIPTQAGFPFNIIEPTPPSANTRGL